ncbi:MAG: rod shape-determining protein MreC [Eggerthellaceae bacterium]|jgi:rod shape-determining protein MreC|nr:rod shape-determining protein MreC [Eggerthellaceae bacterium]MCH4220332.1 rod shape-determining protein MreC [Eggerthellaceae bacterium]
MAFNFQQDSSKIGSSILIIALLLVSLACVTIYMQEGSSGPLHVFQATVSGSLAPAKAASGAISHAEDTLQDTISDSSADASTLTALREQNEQLRSTISDLEEYRQEAQRLQGLLQVEETYSVNGVCARVLSRSNNAWNQVVTLDKGSNDGIHAGQPVLDAGGVIGQVASVSPATSEVRLLADPSSGVAVMVQSNREEGIVTGSLDGVLYLRDLDDNAQVNEGDVIVTSGLGGSYYSGLMVGTVVKVEGNQGDTSRKIIVEQNASASPLEDVLVATSQNSDSSDSSATSSTTGDDN